MNHTTSFEARLVHFLHETFPDSLDMLEGELESTVEGLVEKARSYGIQDEASIAVYVTTAYLLGAQFDTQFPAAAEILNERSYGGAEKAELLESWTRQLFQALEGDGEPAVPDAAPADGPGTAAEEAADASMSDYLHMEAGAGPYRELAESLVDTLIRGHVSIVLRHFSPNFRDHLGLDTVEWVFNQQMLPFFAGATGLGNSCTTTYTHDAFGSQGYAFYFTLNSPDGEKPFVMYMVRESGRIVLANVVLDKVYSS
ncbi:MAG: hypothetical protein ICV83_08075 [Cytophagales bacterium]|nr:hypothetical protein [Cytophagales bacterium]